METLLYDVTTQVVDGVKVGSTRRPVNIPEAYNSLERLGLKIHHYLHHQQQQGSGL
jgi:hypothetical protein